VEAVRILTRRGILVVPDILANAGGVAVSYFEWVQNVQQFSWTADRVEHELMRTMTEAYQEVAAVAGARSLTLRCAAFLVGMDRVANATRSRHAETVVDKGSRPC
jgi:glutamate dehydrogenase (NAD(P)+)